MSKIQVIAIIIRLFAIALFLMIISGVPQLYTVRFFGSTDSVGMFFYVQLAVMIVGILISILIWKFPQTIAKKIIPKTDELSDTKWSEVNFASAGIIIVGIYFLYRALSDLSYWFIFMLYAIGNNPAVKLEPLNKISIYVTIIEFAISIYLVFGSRGITNLIVKFRGR